MSYTPEQAELIERVAKTEIDWSHEPWCPIDPETDPDGYTLACELVHSGELERRYPPTGPPVFRLSSAGRLMLAAVLAEQGRAGLVLARNQRGRGRRR